MSNSSDESQTIRLNCLVLGELFDEIFEVEIGKTAKLNHLKELIVEKNRQAFPKIDAKRLKIWKVDLRVDDNLKDILTSDDPLVRLGLPKQPPSSLTKLNDLFTKPQNEEHLHIIIKRPADAIDLIHLSCFVFGDHPNHVFHIQVPSTATVSALKEAIKEKKKIEFDTIDANHLELWQVDLPINDALEHNVRQEIDHKPPLSPVVEVLKVFSELPRDHLSILIKRPFSGMLPPPPPQGILAVRLAYTDQDMSTPSKAALPKEFAELQGESSGQFFCNRPRTAADPIPVTLLEPIFAQFVDDCQNYEPTDGDYAFVVRLSREMCSFYPSEPERLHVFKQIFQDYGIPLHNATVGSSQSQTDGHMLVGTHVRVIVEGKNEIGSGGAEPFAEAMLYYRKFLKFVKDRKDVFKEHKALLPCFHIICFGACFGIVGSVFSTKVQCDILVPIIPLFWHSTDLPMETMAVRTLAAFKVAVKRLELLPATTPKPTGGDGSVIYPYLQDCVDSGNIQPVFYPCPYPQDYIDSKNIQQTFTYDIQQPFRKRLIFYGKNTSGARICVKFARTYSPEAHRFCADRGHAPKLIAYKPLSGGWNMIIMEFIDIDDSLYRPRSYRHFNRDIPGIFLMEKSITALIEALHAEGYVHGDLRDVNILVRVEDNEGTVISNFMLIDFDWAGSVNMTRYPLGVNRLDVYRPENAQGGHRIMAKDDLDMLRYLFHLEPCLGQKRKWDEAILSESDDA